MIEQDIEIVNKLGLHARAAAKFVAHASRFASDIDIKLGDKTVNGKSIMGVMMLAASKGTTITLTASGDDEQAAIADLQQLINDKFGEGE